MQAYGPGFAKIYDLRWGSFARQTAPAIQAYYEAQLEAAAQQDAAAQPGEDDSRSLLDLCCGAGHLALHFLEQDYRAVCLDLSPHMLEYARKNTMEHHARGEVQFIQADASNFTLPSPVGLVVSTYDALNHLPDLEALKSCFRSVWSALKEGGLFVFDLNTRSGLKRWNTISVEDSPDLLLVTRGIYDGQGGKALFRVTGFVRAENEFYERFEETVYNTVFEMEEVAAALRETGFGQVHPALLQALDRPLEDPEQEGRVFFVAKK
jgi:SAM-dependent methyltransferase